jgi:hypothetical protein
MASTMKPTYINEFSKSIFEVEAGKDDIDLDGGSVRSSNSHLMLDVGGDPFFLESKNFGHVFVDDSMKKSFNDNAPLEGLLDDYSIHSIDSYKIDRQTPITLVGNDESNMQDTLFVPREVTCNTPPDPPSYLIKRNQMNDRLLGVLSSNFRHTPNDSNPTVTMRTNNRLSAEDGNAAQDTPTLSFLRHGRKSMTSMSSLDFSAMRIAKQLSEKNLSLSRSNSSRNIPLQGSDEVHQRQNDRWSNMTAPSNFSSHESMRTMLERQSSDSRLLHDKTAMTTKGGLISLPRQGSARDLMKRQLSGRHLMARQLSLRKLLHKENSDRGLNKHNSSDQLVSLAGRNPSRRAVPSMKHRSGQFRQQGRSTSVPDLFA